MANSWEGMSEGDLPGSCSPHEEERDVVKHRCGGSQIEISRIENITYLLDEKFTFGWDLSIRIRCCYL